MLGAPAVTRLSNKRVSAVTATAALVLSLAAGCSNSSPSGGAKSSGGSTASGGGAGAGGHTVDIKGFAFKPMMLSVPVGTKVTWKFDDSAKHTVVADDKSFKSSAMSGGQTYSFTFAKAGTYSYLCSIHPYMKGTVVVK